MEPQCRNAGEHPAENPPVSLLTLLLFPLKEWAHVRHQVRALLRMIALFLLGIGFMVASYQAALWLFRQYAELGRLAPALVQKTLELLMAFFFGLLTFSSALGAFSSFYMREDLPLLMVAPVPLGRLFLSRFAQTWVQASWMMLSFALPILWASGPVLKAPFAYYLALTAGFIPLSMTGSAIGCLLAMALSRVFPARRNRQAFFVLAMGLFLCGYLALRWAEPERYFNAEGFAQLVQLLNRIDPATVGKHPAGWLLCALFSGLSGRWGMAVLNGTLLLLGCGVTVALGAAFAKATWRRSFALYLEGSVEKPAIASKARPLPAKKAAKVASPLWALYRRDTLIFFRSAGQWSQLLLVAALVVVYIFNFKHLDLLIKSGILGTRGLFFINLLLGTMVAAVLAARFLYPSVSLEGHAFWICQAAPLPVEVLLKSKVLWGFLPLCGCCLLLNIVSNLMVRLPFCESACSALLTLLCAYAYTGMAVGMGACDARFDDPNPAKIASSLGAVLFMLCCLLATGLLTALCLPCFLMLRQFENFQTLPDGPGVWLRIALFVAGIALAFAIHRAPLLLGARALRRTQA